MRRSSLLLTLALSCLLPAAVLAKDPSPSKKQPKEPRPVMSKPQAEALSKCMAQCQQPMKGCMDECKGDNNCNMKCGTNFSQCISKTCENLLPDAAKSDY